MDKESLTLVALIAAIIGVGQMLVSHETITLRRTAGRAIVTAGLGVSAFAALTVFPALPEQAIVGLACMFASFGATGLELMVMKYLEGRGLLISRESLNSVLDTPPNNEGPKDVSSK